MINNSRKSSGMNQLKSRTEIEMIDERERLHRFTAFGGMMASKLDRGSTWSVLEINCLLDVWGSHKIQQLFSGTHRNKDVFK